VVDAYLNGNEENVLEDGVWEKYFTEKPEPFTEEEKRAWLRQQTDVSLASDAFFPFSDNIERAARSGVRYVAEPGGSIRDGDIIALADRYGMVMAFTGLRLFHH
jgi:AICAR transformylase/IMP cyclohydrolase PurH